MLAASLNGALGRAGLIARRSSSAMFGALATVYGIRRQRRADCCASAPTYAWLCARRRRARRRDDGAGADHPRLLARLRPAGRLAHARRALFNVAALWSALEGSILLWVLILAGYTAAVVLAFRKRARRPARRLGAGRDVRRRRVLLPAHARPGQPVRGRCARRPTRRARARTRCCRTTSSWLFHPPILYLGYVGFTVPFAFAIAALVTGRVGEGWLVETRRWTLFAWGFLTVGIVLGAWWSYEVLGWGGVLGAGTRSRTPASCRGSPAPRTSTR